MIKVITFDLDGVYFTKGKYEFINSLSSLGVNEEEAKRVFLKSPQMNEEYKKGKMTDEEFWMWAASEWKLDIHWKKLVDLMIESYDVDSNIVKIVKRVREFGYKTAICTSNFPARISGLQEKFGFLDNFDVKVLSYEVGVNKPDKGIFKKLIQMSNVNPEEIVYADDSEDSVNSARDLGITTYNYDNFDNYILFLKDHGVEI
jgi:HAD superfamily hydrolase (TIGR01509 family)